MAGLLANVMAPDLSGLAAPAREARWMPEPVPSRTRLLGDALRDHGREIRRLPALVRRTLHNLRAVSRWRHAAAVTPPLPLRDVPWTSFNGSLTARRTFVSTALPLDQIGLVRRTFGVTRARGGAGVCARTTTIRAREKARKHGPFHRVSDGIRTHDRRDHNPELYQLSYAHRGAYESTSVVSAEPVF